MDTNNKWGKCPSPEEKAKAGRLVKAIKQMVDGVAKETGRSFDLLAGYVAEELLNDGRVSDVVRIAVMMVVDEISGLSRKTAGHEHDHGEEDADDT